ncbi:glycosyltransferase family 4 protein [Patescibacteria group bacterium]|nr:glycosyltransferase family 4 protein [Patescibacteria group bacterium]
MKIGFYFECSTKSGGVYQYALNLLEALREIREHSVTVFNISPDFPFNDFNLPNWQIVNLATIKKSETLDRRGQIRRETFKRRVTVFILNWIRKMRLYRLEIFLERRNAKKRAMNFLGHDIDLMVFHGPSELSFLTNIPAIVPIHDLEHRRHSEFPELRASGQWQKREYLYNNIKKSAYKILVDSEIGKQDVVEFYGVEPARIEVVPFLPPSYLDPAISRERQNAVKNEYDLPGKFIFYPAQFWPHKNHLNLVKALALLKTQNIIVPAVFVGGKQEGWSAYGKVMEFVRENALEKQVKFLGFLEGDEMSALYKMATALVMPTFLGPTNIPVYEAWGMDCPVLYSDIRGPREQAGPAALLFDPYNPESIAEKIKEIWNNEPLRQDLIARGRARLGAWTRADFYAKIKALIGEFAAHNG